MSGKPLQLHHQLPPASTLAEAKNLPRAIDDLAQHLGPANKFQDEYENGPGDKFTWAQRVVAHPLPPQIRDYAVALRDLAVTPPDPVAIGRQVAMVIDTRTGYRPADIGAFIASITEALAARGFGLPVVAMACREIREANPEKFHNQMPSEFHWIEACKHGKARLEYEACCFERVVRLHDKARDLLARRPEIEAAEQAAHERVQALLGKEWADRIAEYKRQGQARRAEILSSSSPGSK